MPKAKSLKDQVCDFISEKISSGEWLAGEKINEREICEAMEISRTPVREALIKLASDNQIEWRSRKGFEVKEYTESEKKDQYIIASVLDVLSAVLAINYLDEDDYKKMNQAIESGNTAISELNYADYVTASENFHKSYYEKCNNSILISMIDSLRHSFFLPTYHNKDPKKLFSILAELNNQHKRMVDIFRGKNAKALEDFMRQIHWKTRYESKE